MACSHVSSLRNLSPPKLSQSVHREECTLCFDSFIYPVPSPGIDVCLSCFNGACSGQGHAELHAAKTGHGWSVNIQRVPKPKTEKERGEPPTKITKLEIKEAEREEEKWDFVTRLRCWQCSNEPGDEFRRLAEPIIQGILSTNSSARQSEIKAWEEEINPCEHALITTQITPDSSFKLGTKCSVPDCGLENNLWLCLTCASIGCGRAQFGGLPGNSHGLAHFEQNPTHSVVVKLGTITPEGNADLYCYTCNDATLDPLLKEHLATFGVRVEGLVKSEKSMTELQIEHNLQYDFSVSSSVDGETEIVFGSGLTGLKNLGNSCYIASTIQSLFSLSDFQSRYANNKHREECTQPFPAECLECQLSKIADGLLSGRYSIPDPLHHPGSEKEVVFQHGLAPSGFKELIGKGHAEFATMRQQDAEEFLGWLITRIRRDLKARGLPSLSDPSLGLSFATEQRIECLSCHHVRYKVDPPAEVLSLAVEPIAIPLPADAPSDAKQTYEPVELLKTFNNQLLGQEVLGGYQCGDCKRSVDVVKSTKLASLPTKTLVVQIKKFHLVNWVPTKLDIPVILPADDSLTLTSEYLGTGIKDGEVLMSDGDANAAASGQDEVMYDSDVIESLISMGFGPIEKIKRGCRESGNPSMDAGGVEIVMEWLVSHIDDPEPEPTGGAQPTVIDEGSVSMLGDMGFTPAQSRKALKETGGDVERAVEWLFSHPDETGEEDTSSSSTAPAPAQSQEEVGTKSVPRTYRLKAFISHKGPSVHSGHYVAHINTPAHGWVLFNDEKVVKVDAKGEEFGELKKRAYLYIFEAVM